MIHMNDSTAQEDRSSMNWRGLLNRLGPLIGLVFVWTLFATLKWNTFVTVENTKIMLLQTSVVGIAALGATIIIVSGGIDLSVGSVIALGTVTTALFLKAGGGAAAAQHPVLWPALAIVVTVSAAALCGAAIGMMVTGHGGRVAAAFLGAAVVFWLRKSGWPAALAGGGVVFALLLALDRYLLGKIELSPFIVTLGMLGIVRGLAEGMADQQMVRAPATWLNGLLAMRSMPPGVVMMLALAAFTAGLLRYTKFGRHVFAIGSSELTARLCGVPVERTKLLIYAAGVAFAGVAGLLQFSYLQMGDPTTAPGYELNVIAAVVIGGGSLAGGQGSVLGSIIGALIMTVVANGCNKIGLDPWIQKIVTGAIIVTAVALDRLRHQSQRGSGQ